jgi:phosphoribosyl 1,2-cyclic phosphodiesterase
MTVAALRLCVLGSGSSGNAVAVEGPDGIVLIDAGFSPRETRRRMALRGLDPAAVRGIVLTHPDSDHLHSGWTRTAGGLAGLEGPRLHVRRRHAAGVCARGWHPSWFDTFDGPFDAAGIRFDPMPIPHDAEGSTALRVTVGSRVAAHVTDCGRPVARLVEFLAGCDVLCIESNHDPAMQLASGRPPHLIRRIMGGHGHLNNSQALEMCLAVDRRHPLSAVALVHLSRQCNCPALVARLWQDHAPHLANRMLVSGQHDPSPMLEPRARPELATLFDA